MADRNDNLTLCILVALSWWHIATTSAGAGPSNIVLPPGARTAATDNAQLTAMPGQDNVSPATGARKPINGNGGQAAAPTPMVPSVVPGRAPILPPPVTAGSDRLPPVPIPPLLPGQVGANYDIAMQLATQAVTQKSLEIARDNFQAAQRYQPKEAAPHIGLAKIYKLQGLSEQALAEFFEALRLNPNNADARNELGMFLMEQESWDEAAGQFKQVLDVNPNDLSARGNFAICYEQKGQLDEAIQQFKYLAQVAGNNLLGVGACYNLAVAYEMKGDWDAAIEAYKYVIKLCPKHPQAYIQLGNCLVNKGDKKAGEVMQKTAIKIDPTNYRAYIALGRVYELEKRDKEAQEQYRLAVKLNPRAPECEKLLRNLMKSRAKELGLGSLPL